MSEDRALIDLLRREGTYSGVWFAEHLLSAADRLEAAATLSSEREAIGRAAGREDAAKVADQVAEECRDDLRVGLHDERSRAVLDGYIGAAVSIANQARAALPVDGGKDGADG